MESRSFERPERNPFVNNSDKAEEPFTSSKKKEDKKEKNKDRKDKQTPQQAEEKNIHKENTSQNDDEKSKKPTPKPEKKSDEDEESLEAKKQKRQQLIERSLHYKKLYEETPVPRDPLVIARLMVAQHILAIQGQIEQPPIDATPTDELRLLASLDYMGAIADTLENPEVEMSPEMRETCETLIHLAEETLHEGDEEVADDLINIAAVSAEMPGINIEASDKAELRPSSPDTPSSPLPTSGAALIAVLHHVRQQAPQKQPFIPNPVTPVVAPVYAPGDAGGNSLPSTTHIQPISSPSLGRTPNRAAPLITPERPATPESPLNSLRSTRPPEFHKTPSRRSAEPLASLAVAAAFVAAANETSPATASIQPVDPTRPINRSRQNIYEQSPTFTPPVHRIQSQETSPFRPINNNSHAPHYSPEHIPTASLRPARNANPAPPIEISHTPDKPSPSSHKIEHLPLVSLLAMAETVSIGNGQRLRSAYEKGAIDKEGLVKILKSHSKHHDFLQEYKQQVVKRRNLVQTSPEFLHSKQPAATHVSSDSSADNILKEFKPTTDLSTPQLDTYEDFKPTTDLPHPLKQPDGNDPFYTPEEKLFHPAWLVPVLLALLVLVVGILLVFIIFR